MRSMGIGSMLFKAMLDRARKSGIGKAGLIVDFDKPKAEALYVRLGFRTVGTRDFLGHQMKHMQIDLDRLYKPWLQDILYRDCSRLLLQP